MAAGTTAENAAFLSSALPVAGFALIEAASLSEAIQLVYSPRAPGSRIAASRSGRWKRPDQKTRRHLLRMSSCGGGDDERIVDSFQGRGGAHRDSGDRTGSHRPLVVLRRAVERSRSSRPSMRRERGRHGTGTPRRRSFASSKGGICTRWTVVASMRRQATWSAFPAGAEHRFVNVTDKPARQ